MLQIQAEQLLSYIVNSYDKLTKWDEDFVSSIEHQLDIGKKISEKQLKMLSEIYRRISGGGRWVRRERI